MIIDSASQLLSASIYGEKDIIISFNLLRKYASMIKKQ